MSRRTLAWLPLVPVLAGVAAIVVAVRSEDSHPKAVEITSSAEDLATVEELIAASDAVVVATVTGIGEGRQITAPADPGAAITTRIVVLDVSDVLAGSVRGDVIVEEPAALGDGTPVLVDGVAPTDVGDEAVWFLVAGDAEAMPYFAVVNRQGRFTIAGDTLQPASDDALSRQLAALGPDGLVRQIENVARR